MAGKKTYNRIKVVLAEQSKTNLWLAEQIDVSKTTVSRWCTNEMQPTVEGLFFIAEKLKVDVRDLLALNKSKEK